MSHHAETTSLDAATVATIIHRLSAKDQAAIHAERLDLERRLGRRISPLAHFEMMLGNGWGGPGWGGDRPVDVAWGHAGELLRLLPVERDIDELDNELGRLDDIVRPVARPLIEVPRLRKRPGPHGHDDRMKLIRMRELLRTRYDVRGSYTAAAMIVGRDDKDRIKGLKLKFDLWQQDGFPMEMVPADTVRG